VVVNRYQQAPPAQVQIVPEMQQNNSAQQRAANALSLLSKGKSKLQKLLYISMHYFCFILCTFW
jgi:hypothetical protein